MPSELKQKNLFYLLVMLWLLVSCGGSATILDSIARQIEDNTSGTWSITGNPIAAGTFNSCVIYKGAVKCWGNSNSSISASAATTLFSSGGQAVSAGTYHECAVVKEALYCWRIPYSPSYTVRTPTKIIATGVLDVSVGNDDYCAVLKNGTLKCAGRSFTGAFFDTPMTIPFSSSVTQVSVGNDHTCAVVAAALWCWGLNNSGQLGDGTTTTTVTPKEIISSGVQSVSAGIGSTCAVVNNSAKCWGSNTFGQLGDGTNTQRLSPGSAIIASGVTSIQTGNGRTCTIVNQSAYCWGVALKRFAASATTESTTPVQIINGGVQYISLTYNLHSCASVSGNLSCWGTNEFSQLGDGTTTDNLTPTTILSNIN